MQALNKNTQTKLGKPSGWNERRDNVERRSAARSQGAPTARKTLKKMERLRGTRSRLACLHDNVNNNKKKKKKKKTKRKRKRKKIFCFRKKPPEEQPL
jgi:hypothetical protein